MEHVLHLLDRLLRIGDLGIERDHLLRARIGFGQAGERKHLCDVRGVGCPDLRGLRLRREVVVPVRQPDAALHQIRHSFRRVGERLSDEDTEKVFGLKVGGVERIDVGADGRADDLRQLLRVLDCRNAIQRRLQDGRAALVDRVGVRVGRIIVRDARLVRARGGVRIGNRMDEVSEALLGQLVNEIAGADARPVCRNDGRFVPGPIRVIVEVVARSDRLVDPRKIDPAWLPGCACCCAWLLVFVLHAASASADTMTARIGLLIQGPFDSALPTPAAPASRTAEIFDQRTDNRP